ncbi:MAG: hypothetical protein ACKVOU_06685 [Cytophagales bacterium]
MKNNILHIILCLTFFSIFLVAYSQTAKTLKPPKAGFSKSTEQNQATGTPDYVVNQQTNQAQQSISTPKKKKNKKKLFAKKSKEANTARTNAFPSPPSPNDATSYGISAPQDVKNDKQIRKEKSAINSGAVGDDKMLNSNNIKSPRKEAKAGGNLKGGIPSSQRSAKSAEQNQATGTPDYIVEQQSNDAQKIISSPQKPKSTKKTIAQKSQESNTANLNAFPSPPSPNDDISYGITAPEKQVNQKQKLKEKSSVSQKATGQELLEKQYNIKPPREEAKRGGIAVSGVPVNERREKSAESTGYQGSLEPRSEGIPNNSSTSMVIPVNPKSRYDITIITNHQGDYEPKSTGSRNELSTSLVIPVNPKSRNDITIITNHQGDYEPKSTGSRNELSTSLVIPVNPKSRNDITIITNYQGDYEPKSTGSRNELSTSLVIPVNPKSRNDITIMTQHEGDLEPRSTGQPDFSSTSSGDVDESIRGSREHLQDSKGKQAGGYRGEINYAKLSEIRENRKNLSKEMSSNVGDLAGAYQNMKETEKKNAIKVRDYKGTYKYDILADRAAHEKALDREMGSNQGDILGGYEKMRQNEKDNAVKVRDYKGTYNYDILKDRENLRKQKEAEIAKNTGDIIGSYMVMRNRWKDQNKKIEDYRGKIDYDILKKNTDKMKALDKEIYSNTGDILTVSLEKKKSTLREKSRKATGYEGDMIVTKRTRSNHPSAVYIEAKDSKSIEAKEKLRKQLLKKSRHHRDREDPKYMQKEAPRPRYDEREYQIWESKTREGDAGFSNQLDKEEKKITNEKSE